MDKDFNMLIWLLVGFITGAFLTTLIGFSSINKALEADPYFYDATREALVKDHHAEWYTVPTTGKVRWQLRECK